MPVSEFNQYFAAIRIIESRETLNFFTVVDFPHLKSEKRKQVYSQVKAGLNQESNRAQSPHEIARMLGACKNV